MQHGKGLAGTAYSGHYFIRDQENPMYAANFCNALYISVRRRRRSQCRAHYWLENKRRYILRVVRAKKRIKIRSASYTAVCAIQAEFTVIAKARRHMPPLRQHRCIRQSPSHVATHGHRAERAAVIALTARYHAIPRGLATLQKILSRQLDGRLGSL